MSTLKIYEKFELGEDFMLGGKSFQRTCLDDSMAEASDTTVAYFEHLPPEDVDLSTTKEAEQYLRERINREATFLIARVTREATTEIVQDFTLNSEAP